MGFVFGLLLAQEREKYRFILGSLGAIKLMKPEVEVRGRWGPLAGSST